VHSKVEEHSDSTTCAVDDAQSTVDYERGMLENIEAELSSLGIAISYCREIVIKENSSKPREYVKLWYAPQEPEKNDTGTSLS